MSSSPGGQGDPSLDVDSLRKEFPALALAVNGKTAAFFDNPAGTQVPRSVIDGISAYLEASNANTHGAFATSQRTDALITRARQLACAFLGAEDPREIVFGPNMTTLTYSVSRALAHQLEPGDEVVVSDLDHDANVTPWVDLEAHGVVVRRIAVNKLDCSLDMQSFEAVVGPRTRWVAVGYASNAVGTINDVRRIAELAHAVGARVWVDAVHYAPHGPIDVREIGADFVVCSAYKFFGPHLGILWGRRELLEALPVHQLRPAPSTVPERFETGTKNHECLAGLVRTFEYLARVGGADVSVDARRALFQGMRAIVNRERTLSVDLLRGLRSVDGVKLYGVVDEAELSRRVPTFGFTLDGWLNADVSAALAEQGLFTWAGDHYALTLMERLGLAPTGGMVRVGAVHYNTRAEVQRLVEGIASLRGRRGR